jgi:hypothetical protein
MQKGAKVASRSTMWFDQGYLSERQHEIPVEQAASPCFFGLLQAGSLCYEHESDAQLRKH